MQILDVFFKSATILIALTNLFFVIKFFNLKTYKDEVDKERDRRINWLKSLVLDYSLDDFYNFFDILENDLEGLKGQNINHQVKVQINDKISDQFIYLRRKFTDTLFAVDVNLYRDVLNLSDNLQSHLSMTIFDNGVNLAHPPKYQELVSEKLIRMKSDIIKLLFEYRG